MGMTTGAISGESQSESLIVTEKKKPGRKTNAERELIRLASESEFVKPVITPEEFYVKYVASGHPASTLTKSSVIKLGIYRTHPDIELPSFGTQESACFDLRFNPAGKQEY